MLLSLRGGGSVVLDYAFVTIMFSLLTPTPLRKFYCVPKCVFETWPPAHMHMHTHVHTCTHMHMQHGSCLSQALFGSQPRLNHRKVPGIKCLALAAWCFYWSSHPDPQAFSPLLSDLLSWKYLKRIFTNMYMTEKDLKYCPVLNSH